MNVNPFSYLIEKLKGKVNKSGDTMTGKLNIERSGESYVRAVNTDKQVGAYLDADANAEHGVWSNGYNNGSFQSLGRWLLKRGTSGDVYVNDTKVPYNGGTVALTSDISSFIHFQNFSGTTDASGNLTISPNILNTQGTVLGAVIVGYIVRVYVNNSNLWRVNVLTTDSTKVSNTNVSGYVFYVNEKP